MLNQLWGGLYNNQVGTHEFVDFCRRVGADPLLVVNFESDGRRQWATDPKGDLRSGNASEATEWVEYCNGPSNALRRQHDVEPPYGVKLWQIGNETSYDRNGFDLETAATKTLQFAQAMRKADPRIALIGWGDSGWAERMAEVAGEQLQYLAFHHHFGPGSADSPLRGTDYRKDPARTWDYLMRTCRTHEQKITEMRQQVARYKIPLALTECHFALPGRNRCEVLSSWAAGVANARLLNVHERNGDILKIATLADFCGTLLAEQRHHDSRAGRKVVHDARGDGHEPAPKAFGDPGCGTQGCSRRPRCGGQPHRRPRVPPRREYSPHAVH
jgi:hypothetical protein